MSKIGMRNFNKEDLIKNYDELTMAIAKKRPENVKGKYFLRSAISTTMGPPVPIDLEPYIKVVLASQQ